jgi:hypothetical protein
VVDPVNITNYKLNDKELEEYILFCIAVAGKTAKVVSARLDKLLICLHQEVGEKGWNPFYVVSQFTVDELAAKIKCAGIGCHTLKARGFFAIAKMGLDLRRCTVEELEKCPGVGHKTSRFFILHTRRDAEVACLDRHILKWMSDLGYDVPKSSPQNKAVYRRVEGLFLKLARANRMSPARLDLYTWCKYSGNLVSEGKVPTKLCTSAS